MKTSISEIIQTERFLRDELSPDDKLVFEARLLIDDELRTNTILHRITHRLVLLYRRARLKAEIDEMHTRLMSDPANSALRESVRLFKS